MIPLLHLWAAAAIVCSVTFGYCLSGWISLRYPAKGDPKMGTLIAGFGLGFAVFNLFARL